MSNSGKQVPLVRRKSLKLPPYSELPDYEDLNSVRQWLQSRPRPWAIDLFSGAGGLSLGLEQAGFSVVVAADYWKDALDTHRANVASLTWQGDLSTPESFLDSLSGWGIREVDLVAGGPPCQPFSNAGIPKIASLVRAGNRRPRDPRRDLWRSFFQVIDSLAPKAVLFENVPDLARSQEGAVLVQLLRELEGRNYETWVQVLSASQVGVPQYRKRLIVVAIRGCGQFEWPDASKDQPTLRDAIGDLPPVPPGQMEDTINYQELTPSPFAREMRSGLAGAESQKLWDHVTRFVRPDDADAFAVMEEGDKYLDIPDHLRRYRDDIFRDKYFRLRWDSPSRSITAHLAKDGYWYIHPDQDRTLSVREAARIQTFPDGFRFAGSMTSGFAQIGNAVPPTMAKALGSAIRKSLDAPVPKGMRKFGGDNSRFRASLVRWFRKNGRRFSWRDLRDPWAIFLAECCLHRTQADQVAAVFDRLVELAPTAQTLIENEDRFRVAAASLGLNWRIDLLVEAAEILVRDHGGVPPEDWTTLRSLPGVGDYAASAVMCFSYGHRAVLLDTNTIRISRRLTGKPDMAKWESRLELYRRSGKAGPDAEWNYSLLDLGGSVCTARRPNCGSCPLVGYCETGGRINLVERS